MHYINECLPKQCHATSFGNEKPKTTNNQNARIPLSCYSGNAEQPKVFWKDSRRLDVVATHMCLFMS